MTLKDIRMRIQNGDFTNLSKLGNQRRTIDPAELAKIISAFEVNIVIKAFSSIPERVQPKTFAYFDKDLQQHIVNGISREKGSAILNELDSDERFAFYGSLKVEVLASFIKYLTVENREETFNFLGYPKKSVARFINTDFATVSSDMTIAQASELLRKNHKDTETVNVIYVIDDKGKLVDDIPIRRLVLNEPSKKIEEILDGFYVSLLVTESKADAVAKFKEYDRVVLPVVDKNNILIGIVTVDDVLDIEEQTTTEEMQKFGGLETLDDLYVKTSLFSLIKKRAGWLIILFLGEMLTATAMGYFD